MTLSLRYVALLDQGMWALRSLLLVALIARLSSPDAFGLFGIGLTTLILTAGAAASMSGEVVAVTRHAIMRQVDDSKNSRLAVTSVSQRGLGAVILLAVLSPVLIWIIGVLLSQQPQDEASLWLLFGAPLAVFVEGARALMYAQAQGREAFRASFCWLLIQLGVFMGPLVGLPLNVSLVMGAWVLGAAVAAVLVTHRLRVRPRLRGTGGDEWRRRADFLAQFLLTAGPSHATLLIAGALGGLPAAGAMRALQSVFGPLNVVIGGLGNAVIPRVAQSPGGARTMGYGLALATGGVGVGVTGVLMVAPELGSLLMGVSWPESVWLVCAYGLGRIAHAVTFSAMVVYRAADWGRRSSILRILTAVALLTAFTLGCTFNLSTALWAFGLVGVFASVIWWAFAPRSGDLDPARASPKG